MESLAVRVKLSPCCEAPSDERSAGNLHATFCGSRGAGNRPRQPGGHQATGVPTAIASQSPNGKAITTVNSEIRVASERIAVVPGSVTDYPKTNCRP